MPFGIQGGYVVNLDTGEKKNKKPMPHARLVAYQRALYANSPDIRHKEVYVGNSQGKLARRGKKPPSGLHSFIQPPEVTIKAAPKQLTHSDSLLGKHPEPHGVLRLRSMQGRYFGIVGKRLKRITRIKEWLTGFKAGYSSDQARDSHGRWTSAGFTTAEHFQYRKLWSKFNSGDRKIEALAASKLDAMEKNIGARISKAVGDRLAKKEPIAVFRTQGMTGIGSEYAGMFHAALSPRLARIYGNKFHQEIQKFVLSPGVKLWDEFKQGKAPRLTTGELLKQGYDGILRSMWGEVVLFPSSTHITIGGLLPPAINSGTYAHLIAEIMGSGRTKEWLENFKTYSPSQQRDDHGRWAAVGSALHKLGKTRLRPKVQGAPAGIYHQVLKPLNPLARGLVHLGTRAIQHKLNPPRLIDIIDEASSKYARQVRARHPASFKAGYSAAESRDDHGRWTAGAILHDPRVISLRKKLLSVSKVTAAAVLTAWAADFARREYGHWKWQKDYERDAKKWGEGMRQWMKDTGNYFSEAEAALAFNQWPGAGEMPTRPGIHAYRWPQYPNWQVFGGLLPPPKGKEVRLKAGYNAGQPRDYHGRWSSGGLADIILHGGVQHHISNTISTFTAVHEGAAQAMFSGAFHIVDHKLRGVEGEDTANGLYHYGNHSIEVSTKADYPGLTTAHEIGHSLDHTGFNMEWASGSSGGPLKGWRGAVMNSSEYRQMAAAHRNDNILEAKGQRFRVSDKFFSYLLSPRELWARSFAQWHAIHSSDRSTRRELRFAQKQQLPYYWSDKSFKPIDREITRIMKRHGYTK